MIYVCLWELLLAHSQGNCQATTEHANVLAIDRVRGKFSYTQLWDLDMVQRRVRTTDGLFTRNWRYAPQTKLSFWHEED